MALAKRLIRNTSWIFMSDIIGNIFSFLLVILIARYLGDSGLGIYSYAIAFVSSVYFLLDMGILYYTTREMSRHFKKIRLYASNLLTLRLFFCVLAFLLSVIPLFFIESDKTIRLTILLAAVAMFFNYFSWVFRPLFQVYEKLKFEAISRIAERTVAFLLGAYFLVVLKQGITYFMLVFVVSYSVFFISRVFFAKRFTQINFGFDLSVMREILIKSLPFWAIMIFIKLYLVLNTLMLSWLTKNYALVGWYTASSSLLDGLTFIPAAVSLVLFPAMSKLFVRNKKTLSILLNLAFKYYIMFLYPLCIGVFLLADRIIPLVYPGFSNSITILQILVWAVAIGFITQFFGFFLQAINKQNYSALIVVFATLSNIMLNLILIPPFTYIGAGIATLITEIAVFILLYWLIVRFNFRIALFKLSYPTILAGSLMGILIYFLYSQNLVLLVLTGVVAFFIGIILFKGIRKDDINLFMEAVR